VLAIISCVQQMFNLAALWQLVAGYAVNDDPLTAASNRLALIIASNQPFYPLYVRWVTGETSVSLGLTFLSTPFFLASPWIAKRFVGVGRLWFPAIGAINTFFCGFIFGEASGVEWFLLPCIVIAVLSCRAMERRALFVFSVALSGAFAMLHGRYGDPLFQTLTAQAAFRSLNIYSALVFSVIALWILWRARS
jgi:hypothetical protein